MINRVSSFQQNNASVQAKPRTSFGSGFHMSSISDVVPSITKEFNPITEHRTLLNIFEKITKGDFSFKGQDDDVTHLVTKEGDILSISAKKLDFYAYSIKQSTEIEPNYSALDTPDDYKAAEPFLTGLYNRIYGAAIGLKDK